MRTFSLRLVVLVTAFATSTLGMVGTSFGQSAVADGTVATIARAPERVGILGNHAFILALVEVVVPEGQQVEPQQAEQARRIHSWTEATSDNQQVARYRVIAEGSTISQGLFKNAGPLALRVTLVSVDGERTLVVPAGDGFFVGDLALAPPSHEMQCECKCETGTVPAPAPITVKCPSATQNDTCPCDTLNDIDCKVGDATGTTAECKKILVPVQS
jgi:F0F1-type ATP synthase membrane subunit c/vacuolar-type H+-ATPase subunit K